jgi:hypothetical protein
VSAVDVILSTPRGEQLLLMKLLGVSDAAHGLALLVRLLAKLLGVSDAKLLGVRDAEVARVLFAEVGTGVRGHWGDTARCDLGVNDVAFQKCATFTEVSQLGQPSVLTGVSVLLRQIIFVRPTSTRHTCRSSLSDQRGVLTRMSVLCKRSRSSGSGGGVLPSPMKKLVADGVEESGCWWAFWLLFRDAFSTMFEIVRGGELFTGLSSSVLSVSELPSVVKLRLSSGVGGFDDSSLKQLPVGELSSGGGESTVDASSLGLASATLSSILGRPSQETWVANPRPAMVTD